MYGYIYKTTCLVNNKIYIGQHCSNTFNPKYLGSGVAFLKAVKKYGKDNFKTTLLEEVTTNQGDLNKLEQHYIRLYNSTDDKIGYNLDNGGTGLGKHSEQTKLKISAAELGKEVSEATKAKMQDAMKKRLQKENGRQKLQANFRGGMLGKKHSAETIEKMKLAKQGQVCSEEQKAQIAKANSKKVRCVELDIIFDSYRSAAKYFKQHSTAGIARSIKTKKYRAAGYH